jgi:hypothetical protein
MYALHKRRLTLLLMLMLCLTCVARAQSGGGSVRMSGVVSETVALSIPQWAEAPGVSVNTTRNADRSLIVILSGSAHDRAEVRVPIQIRSNAGYRLFATAEARGAVLSSLLVTDARPTGTLVAPNAAGALSVASAFDGRSGVGSLNRPDLSAPSELLSGPRVSTGGTMLSPHNALEVVLSITVEPRADTQGWTVELRLSADPGERLP